jgi:hypothetical protein
MADKNFGVKGINFISDPGTPTISIASSTISYAGSLNLNADTVAISTNVSIGGSVVSNIIVSNSYSVGIGTTILTEKLNISGNANISGIVSATSFVGSGSSLTGLVSNQLTSVDTNYPYYILLTRSQTGTSTTIASSYNYIYYNPNSKYLGIGTDAPTANLDVNGTGRFVGTVTAPTFQGTATTATTALGFSTSASVNTSGIITATGGFNIGIQSGGTNITTGVITAINFIGSGNTFSYNSTTKVVDVTIFSGISSVSISSNTTNQEQYIPYATSFGNTTGFGATTLLVYNPSSGNLGIGTTNPTTRISIAGTTGISFADTNIRLGDVSTGSSITTGVNNFFAGVGAGKNNSTGNNNNFLGLNAGYGNTSNRGNNFLGEEAGYNSSGDNNNFLGDAAGLSNKGGINNFFGPDAGRFNNGGYNNFFGYFAGYISYGDGNNFFGVNAGRFNTGVYNNFFGGNVGYNNLGNQNNFLGERAGYNNSGNNNNFFGYQAGYGNNRGGNDNNFFGYQAGYGNTSGSNNIAIGQSTGYFNQTGSENVIIGSNQQAPILNGSNQLVIGAGSTAWIVGNSSYNVGIGTTRPTAKVHIGAATTSAAGSAPLKIGAGTTILATPEVGAIEYDGSYLYQTPNSTSGRAYVPPVYSFRLTATGANINATITDFFATPSSLSLEAASVYKITCFAYFTKGNAGAATWTQTFSAAPTIAEGHHWTTPLGGISGSVGYTQLEQYFYNQYATIFAWQPSASSLTDSRNHFYRLDMTVLTNAATNWRLRLTQSAGTVTPLAGSFYTIEKVGPSTGTFVA